MQYVICIMTITVFTACSESDSNDSDLSGKTLKLQKMDLDGAKYLSLTGNDTRATGDGEVGLFKIDEKGNMTTVVLTVTEEEDGTVKRTRTDIKVIPRNIYQLAGIYTFMQDCSFTDGNGNDVYMKYYYEPDVWDFNILVRNSDGAIFYIPSSIRTYFQFECLQSSVKDDKGNLYLSDQRNIGMITIQNGQLVLKQVNPNNIDGGGQIFPFDNGTVMTFYPNSRYLDAIFFYPNGGFEEYKGYRETYENGTRVNIATLSFSKGKSGIKAVVVKEIEKENMNTEHIVSLCDFHVGSSYGSWSFSEPISSLSSGTDYSLNENQPNYLDWVSKYHANTEWLQGVYETTNNYFIGSTLVVDKHTLEMRPLVGTESYVIFPNEKNTYKGRAWVVGSWGANWYDIETMQYGRVEFNLPSDLYINKEEDNIPSGQLILYGIRYSDGMSVTYFVNIETGEYVCTESNSERPITALIPLN